MNFSLSSDEFEARFPRRKPAVEMRGVCERDLTIDEDTVISGVVEGDLKIPKGRQVIITGVVEGDVNIDEGAVAFIEGAIEGDVNIYGAASIKGAIDGDINYDDNAVVHNANDAEQWRRIS